MAATIVLLVLLYFSPSSLAGHGYLFECAPACFSWLSCGFGKCRPSSLDDYLDKLDCGSLPTILETHFSVERRCLVIKALISTDKTNIPLRCRPRQATAGRDVLKP
jgi:hypothetical protein